jgi:hypothetical protein
MLCWNCCIPSSIFLGGYKRICKGTGLGFENLLRGGYAFPGEFFSLFFSTWFVKCSSCDALHNVSLEFFSPLRENMQIVARCLNKLLFSVFVLHGEIPLKTCYG